LLNRLVGETASSESGKGIKERLGSHIKQWGRGVKGILRGKKTSNLPNSLRGKNTRLYIKVGYDPNKKGIGQDPNLKTHAQFKNGAS